MTIPFKVMKSLVSIVLLMATASFVSAQSKNVTASTDPFTGFTKLELKAFDFGPFHGFPDASYSDGQLLKEFFSAVDASSPEK